MSRPDSPPPSPSASSRRRSSFNAQSLSELFGRSNSTNTATATPAYPGSIATAAAQAHNRRRVSITTLGLSGSPSQVSPLGSRGLRRGSISSSVRSGSPGADESAIEEGDALAPQNTPASPFARRVSFGANALREVRAGSGSNNGRDAPYPAKDSGKHITLTAGRGQPLSPIPSRRSSSSNPLDNVSNNSRRSTGDGFNWSESLRTRAERAPSIGNGAFTGSINPANAQNNLSRQRAVSTASLEHPIKEIPKTTKPDYFQEKILKGDFMD